MLRVSLLGNLGADPELRYSQKGTPIATFRVAVHQVRTGPDGERQESTEWFRVRAAGRLSEFTQGLGKGTRVLVEGRLEVVRYQSREGEPRVGFDVWADQVVNLSARLPGAEAEAEAALEADGADPAVSLPAIADEPRAGSPAVETRQRPATVAVGATDELDELPF